MSADYWEIRNLNIIKYLPFLNLFVVGYVFVSDMTLNVLAGLSPGKFMLYCIALLIIVAVSPLAWKKNEQRKVLGGRFVVWLALIVVSLLTKTSLTYFLYYLQIMSMSFWYKSFKHHFGCSTMVTVTYLLTFFLNPILNYDFFRWGIFGILINYCSTYLLYVQNENKKKLKQLSKIFKIMLETTNNGIQFIDAGGRTRILNPAAQIIYGHSQDESLGKNDWDLYFNGDKFDERGGYTSLITESLETGKIHKDVERIFTNRLGITKAYLVETFRVFDEDEGEIIGAFGIYRDITEQKEMERQLLDAHYEMANMAVTDELTNLYNVRYFRQRLTTEIAKFINSNLSLLIIDVDYFKSYNDLYGHPQGDLVLQQIGKILKESFRETDIVARYGGEEFTVILPGMDKEKAKEVAERIRLKIKRFKFEGQEQLPTGTLTVTIGVASVPEDASNAEQLIKIADYALYKGKYSTRDIVVTLDNLQKELELAK
ncbi:MAG: sensor domain-containing diguanylate cyclase [Peptococcaceae bacterium]